MLGDNVLEGREPDGAEYIEAWRAQESGQLTVKQVLALAAITGGGLRIRWVNAPVEKTMSTKAQE